MVRVRVKVLGVGVGLGPGLGLGLEQARGDRGGEGGRHAGPSELQGDGVGRACSKYSHSTYSHSK